MAVRLFVEVDGRLMAQGETALVSVYGVDVHGNLVSFTKGREPPCNAGSISHLVDATWVVDLRKAGTDRSCTAETNDGLQAQTWFEVESVLLGGALGSSNSVVSLGGALLLGVLALMIVLLRRQSLEVVEDLLDEIRRTLWTMRSRRALLTSLLSRRDRRCEMVEPTLEPDVLSAMAQEATTSGVMQAIPGTEQGATGWYVDANATVQALDRRWRRFVDQDPNLIIPRRRFHRRGRRRPERRRAFTRLDVASPVGEPSRRPITTAPVPP